MRASRLASLLVAAFVIAVGGSSVLAEPAQRKNIYFGDLHTHSNLSGDAVLMQVLQGIDRDVYSACTYARACAQADFYGQSDHAEMLFQDAWNQSIDAVKSCNQDYASPAPDQDPEMVVFQGFEWTSSAKGIYWGHKNVFFRNDTVPEMPVGNYAVSELQVAQLSSILVMMKLFQQQQVTVIPGLRAIRRTARINSQPRCGTVDAGKSCVRIAEQPQQLWEILNSYYDRPEYRDAGYDVTVIPHGTSWGMAKLGTDWSIQLNGQQHDPNLQRIIEVYSGHGNSEEYRDFSDPDIPYQSCGDRAAQMQMAWCLGSGGSRDSCQADADQARTDVQVSFPTTAKDWGLCNQCQDCYQPAERYQPAGSVQSALARTGIDGNGNPLRYQFGFIAATDDHVSRPASVKEVRAFSDSSAALAFQGGVETPFAPDERNRVEAERVASYFYPGGLVAIHAERRTRDSLWQALKRREVHGTSGPRIELWFNARTDAANATMGSRLTTTTSPEFTIEAWGGPTELAGCNAATRQRWGDELIDQVCLGECYNPGDRRTGIERFEIVRIRPQQHQSETIAPLIEDPWKVIENTRTTPDGRRSPNLTATFTDPEFAGLGRDATYYVRVIQEPTESVNGIPMRNADGQLRPCPMDDLDDQCLTMARERAWSSPIYVDYGPSSQ